MRSSRSASPGFRLLPIFVLFASTLMGLGLIAMAVLLQRDASFEAAHSVTGLSDIPFAFTFLLVGGIVTIKRPDNRVGWALSISGLGFLLMRFLAVYADLALLAKPEAGLPAGAAAAAIGSGAWTAAMAGIFLLLLLFPSGHVQSLRWRWPARLVPTGFAALWIVIAGAPGTLDPPLQAFENPLALTDGESLVVAGYVLAGACLLGVGFAAIDLIRRFRRSRGTERQQFKWLAASAALLIATFPLELLFGESEVTTNAFGVALLALPVSVGVAILRHRLYEIDVIIRRTLVYGSLTIMLGATYAGVVLAAQLVLSPLAGGSNLAIAISTLAAAALFLPLRSRVQRFVDRRFYRRRYDAQRTLEAFAARLREQVDLETLQAELRSVVDATMQPAAVSLWLRTTGTAP